MSVLSGICALLIVGGGAAPDSVNNQAFLGKKSYGDGNATLGPRNDTSLELLSSRDPAGRDQPREQPLCKVREALERGEKASYFVYNTYHSLYLSTDGTNVDLWKTRDSHAVWHFYPANTESTFYIVNDRHQKYMDSEEDWDGKNVHLWVSDRGIGYMGSIPENLRWRLFDADHITQGTDPCTFYILHEGSNEWLDSLEGNVHVSPQLVNVYGTLDSQWKLIPTGGDNRGPRS